MALVGEKGQCWPSGSLGLGNFVSPVTHNSCHSCNLAGWLIHCNTCFSFWFSAEWQMIKGLFTGSNVLVNWMYVFSWLTTVFIDTLKYQVYCPICECGMVTKTTRSSIIQASNGSSVYWISGSPNQPSGSLCTDNPVIICWDESRRTVRTSCEYLVLMSYFIANNNSDW